MGKAVYGGLVNITTDVSESCILSGRTDAG